ncbi:unnamed protein product [Closterium sp. NIES-65]|nr:unnamed protein product [Closterium sp. NIES-65]
MLVLRPSMSSPYYLHNTSPRTSVRLQQYLLSHVLSSCMLFAAVLLVWTCLVSTFPASPLPFFPRIPCVPPVPRILRVPRVYPSHPRAPRPHGRASLTFLVLDSSQSQRKSTKKLSPTTTHCPTIPPPHVPALTFLVLDSSQSTDAPFPFLSAFSSSFQKPHWRSRPITAQQQQQLHNQQQQQQGRWRSQPLAGVFDVVAYGAVGDAVTDDTHALTTAMHAACSHAAEKGVVATVLVPWGGCYSVQPITMQGPCGPGMRLQIDGVLVGPSDPAAYPFPDYTSTYFPYTSGFLSFKNFSGLVISGGGRIDGQGQEFWKAFRNYTLQKTIPIRPFAIRLMHCKNTTVEGISIWNSPMYHLFAYTCDGLHIRRYKTNSPSRSPNTDSLKLVGIKNALIEECFLHGGDDDVSVVAVGELVAYNITVRNLEATAGHGISIGSVGWDGNVGCVAKVRVVNVTLINLTNGIRIKTWQGGLGVVRDVFYENIHMKNTSKAIMLNQVCELS